MTRTKKVVLFEIRAYVVWLADRFEAIGLCSQNGTSYCTRHC
jgi:hypothetical protein